MRMKKSKKTEKTGNSESSTATSKPSCAVKVTARLTAQIKALSKAERQAVGEAIAIVQRAWGQPHAHGAVGIRRLRKNVFECRANLDRRLAFMCVAREGELVFFAMGNHDEIQNLIRTL
jgi:hypothetical protein